MLSVVDSNWKLNLLPLGKYHPDQPADVNVLHGYAQLSDVPGNHIEKPMSECTGAEMFAEALYHCGLKGKIAAILEHSKVHTAALPYITSQFMPRKISDRPEVIPDGCINLAFLGQYVELPEDVVFTVETSVRTAMMAVWGLTGLEKPMVPMPAADLRRPSPGRQRQDDDRDRPHSRHPEHIGQQGRRAQRLVAQPDASPGQLAVGGSHHVVGGRGAGLNPLPPSRASPPPKGARPHAEEPATG